MSDEIKIPKRTAFLVLGVVLVLVVGFAIGWLFKPIGTGAVIGAGNDAGTGVPSIAKLNIKDEPALGDSSAPVQIIEFTDFQCPFCQRAFSNTYPLIKSNYIDTGKAYYVVKDFPLENIHPQANAAAQAANCASEQEKYWEMHDTLFANQEQWAGQANVNTIFSGYASDLELDVKKFDSCLASGKYVAEIQQDLQEGISAGVTGTPTFFINGKQLVGAQPYSAFQAAIDSEL